VKLGTNCLVGPLGTIYGRTGEQRRGQMGESMRRVLASAVLLILVGCGGSTAKVATTTVGTSSSPPSPVGSTPPSVTTAQASATTNPTPAGADENPLDGAALCAFLEQDLPKLKSAGSAAGALSFFAGDFGVWLDDHPTQKPRTASDLDSASEGACPALRSQVVAALGGDSFQQVLG
jgi:hypothetical protein